MSVIINKGPIIDPGVCRCCGATKKCRLLNGEYEGLGRREIYSEMFLECFGLLLSHLDGEVKDRLICATCVTRLREASCFRQQVLECEEKLLKAHFVEEYQNDIKKKEVKVENETGNEMDVGSSQAHHENQNDIKIKDIKIENEAANEMDVGSDREPEQIQDNIEEKSSSLKKIEIKKLQSNVKSNTNVFVHMNVSRKIIKRKSEEDNKPLIKLTKKGNYTSEKSLSNLIMIVENSYVCPFNSFFNYYYCIYCRQKFIECEKLREHTMIHDSKTYKNVIKNRNKTRQIDLHRIDCRLCDENINTIESFKQHITTIHRKKLKPVNDDFLKFNLTENNLKCTECNKKYGCFAALKKHMAEHFGSFICEICGVHYFEDRMLVAHMKSHQPSNITFKCNQCGKVFKSKYNLSVHTARLHTKEAVYLCAKCDETFFSDTLRRKHMKDVHGEESIFKCENCDKIYNCRRTLREHNKRIHLRLLKHQCGVCEKSFFLPSQLKDHMSSHTGERNYRCDQCGKSYPRLKALKVHMQSHKIDKKYKCTICSASYAQNVCLKNHIKRQHPDLESQEN